MNALQTIATAEHHVSPNTQIDRRPSVGPAPGPSRLGARMVAKFLPARFDRQLADGVAVTRGSALEVHANRLGSATEKRELANALCKISDEPSIATQPHRAPIARARVVDAHELIDELRARLQQPGLLNVQGIAQLRMLLASAAGPFYQCGSGDLRHELSTVLAAI